MADLKTSKQITAEIEKQRKLLKSLDNDSVKYKNTQKEIVRLQELAFKARQKESAQARESLPLYRQIEGSIKERLKKVKELQTVSGKSNELQKEMAKAHGRLYQRIQDQVKINKDGSAHLNDASKEQLDILDSINLGQVDIAALNEQIAQSKKKQNELSDEFQPDIKKDQESLTKILQGEKERIQLKQNQTRQTALQDKLTGGLVSKTKAFAKEFKEANEEGKALLIATLAIGAGLKLLKQLVSLGKEFAKTFDEIGKQFGSINLLGRELQGQILASNIEAIKLGSNVGDIGSVASELASNFGMTLEEATGLSVKVIDTSKALGISVSEGTQLFGVLTQTANLSAEQAEKLSEGAAQLARQRGVAPAQVMKDIAGSAETIALFTKDSGENIFDAAIAARQFGMSINDIASSMKGMLDFESSINAELEASAILGKTINLQRARELALNKDAVGFQKEIKSQLEGIGNFNDLGILQQESLAKALNMNVAQVAKLANGTAEIGDGLGDQSFEDLLGKDALSNFSQLAAQLSSIGAILVSSVGPALGSIAGFLVPVLEGFGKFLTYLNESGALMPMVMTALGGLGVALTATGIKFAFLAGKAIYSTFASLGAMVGSISASTLGLGALGAIALAGVIGAAVKSMMSDANAIAVDDMYAGPGGITTMMGPAGIFSLNPRDSVLATTNPIPVTKVNEFPAEGALMPGHSPSTMVNVGGEFRIHSGDLRLLTERQENGGGDLGVPTITYR